MKKCWMTWKRDDSWWFMNAISKGLKRLRAEMWEILDLGRNWDSEGHLHLQWAGRFSKKLHKANVWFALFFSPFFRIHPEQKSQPPKKKSIYPTHPQSHPGHQVTHTKQTLDDDPMVVDNHYEGSPRSPGNEKPRHQDVHPPPVLRPATD